ncbi:MAG TPA: cytochrome c oxidase subunit 3 [Usitatibacter sp.]|nr:cytochrome c oxidase subunit 3 [Usitatibacter sp.]
MSARPDVVPVDVPWRRETASLGMWIFLATEVMFFGVLFLAYTHARLADPQGFAAASRLTHEWLGTINTAILLTSSLTMALAVRSGWAGHRALVIRLLWATAFLGAAFIAVKLVEYRLEWRDGLVPALHFTYSGPHARAVQAFFFLYFVMTGVHAVHLTIGVALVAWLALRDRDPSHPVRRRETAECLGLYWHFVDGIWIFLYPLIYLVELWR